MNSDDLDDDLNHIDDAIEDFEEDWDDESLFDEGDDSVENLSEQDDVKPSKKSKSSGKSGFLIIAIAILAGLAYAIYPILMGNNSDNIPVVKLENPQQDIASTNDTVVDNDENEAEDYLVLNENKDVSDFENSAPSVDFASDISVEEDGDVLTPMVPNNNVILHDLDVVENNSDEFFDDNFDDLENSLYSDIEQIEAISSIDNINENEDLRSNIDEATAMGISQDNVMEQDDEFMQEKVVSEAVDLVPEKEIPVEDSILSNSVSVEKTTKTVDENAGDIIVSSDKDVSQEKIIEEKPVQIEKPKVVRKPVWIIRAAQPGRAVIFDKTTGEIKSVEVGNTVLGIGKVETISKSSSGKWVVQGTLGSIK